MDKDRTADWSRGLWYRLLGRPWFVSAVALVPFLWIIGAHFRHVPKGSLGTGFLQSDQAYYMANARQLINDGFHLLYGLPFSPDYDTPRVYFQPQIAFLAFLWKETQLDPGLIFLAFGLAAGLIFFRIAIALYTAVVGLSSVGARGLLPIFMYGGGMCVIVGAIALTVMGRDVDLNGLFELDPFDGYWFLNLGRNVVYSLESYYHALFLGTMLLLVRQRFGWALVTMAVLSASHPFTGMQLLSIIVIWNLLELLTNRNTAPPPWFLASSVALISVHLGYYLFLLNQLSPEHKQIQAQWSLPWNLHWYNILVAYGPVALAAVWRLRSYQRIQEAFSDRTFRLLASWFAVSFLLANHDKFVAAHQPLHFTRGYIWAALFLMGAPAMVEVLNHLLSVGGRGAKLAVATALGLMLLDNSVWFYRYGRTSGLDPVTSITRDTRDVFYRLNNPQFAGALAVAETMTPLPYLLTVYTPLRTWYSHGYNTPQAEKRKSEVDALFRDGTEVDEWRHRFMVAIIDEASNPGAQELFRALGYKEIYKNESLVIMDREPVN